MTAPSTEDLRPADAAPANPGSMPGWHVVADLTPPELIASRRLKVVRLLVLIAVVIVAAGCVGGYYYAHQQATAAADDLAAAQATSATLQAQQRRYTSVTTLQHAIDAVRGQVATLMTDDVDFSALIGDITAALPAGMSITQAQVTITPTGAVGAAGGPGGAGSAGNVGGASALDASGDTHIGTITLAGTGTGKTLDDLAAYVQKLRSVAGVFDPYPLTNVVGETGTTFSLQITLTAARLSHAFDTGGK